MNKIKALIDKYKYPLIMLVVGIAIISLPTGSKIIKSEDNNSSLQELLEASEGVGAAYVLVSDSGAVVVCTGADNALVRLNILKAVKSYTGLSYDKVTILKAIN